MSILQDRIGGKELVVRFLDLPCESTDKMFASIFLPISYPSAWPKPWNGDVWTARSAAGGVRRSTISDTPAS